MAVGSKQQTHQITQMKFNCQDISISDESFGCTISLSENRDEYNEEKADQYLKMSPGKVAESIGRYILLQRSYPEDEFEKDYYYFETSDETESGELENFKIELYPTRFLMYRDNQVFDIDIKPSKKDLARLKIALKKIVNDHGELLIHD
jgi:hypothetical protein